MSRSERIELRLSPDEHAAWKGAAGLEERSLSDWIRLRVNSSLRQTAEPTTQPWDGPLPDASPLPLSEWPDKTLVEVPQETTLRRPEDTAVTIGSLSPGGSGGLRHESTPVETPDPVNASPLPPELSEPQCRMAPFHVKGRYCKVCGEVPE